jgi:ATP-dependent Clp protease protease subunit
MNDSIGLYLNDIGKVSLLNAEEERELSRVIEAGREAADRLANGEKGERSALPYGTVMLSQPRGGGARGQASDIAIKAREILTNRRVALEIMSKATGVSIEQLTEDTNRVKYMDAQQALEYGIVDKIVKKTQGVNDVNKATMSSLSRGLG